MQSRFGVSFSLHRASELGIDKKDCLRSAIDDLGFRRFRLMSYWNIHEQKKGHYNFKELDWQLDMVSSCGGQVSLCLGKRQPRWPECHMPEWAQSMSTEDWREALYTYIEAVVVRYREHPALDSWQLENEALLKDFGYCVDQDYDRKRLDHELRLVRQLDPSHPIIMTLSDSYGLPVRKPRPDKHAMSLYRTTINKRGKYAHSLRPALFYRVRAELISIITGHKPFIHELQAEPWLQTAIVDSLVDHQLELMNPEIFRQIIDYATKTGMDPIDLWGLEWWYWLKRKSHPEMWHTAKELVAVA